MILAFESGPIRVFKNDRGHFHEITKALGLDQYSGWWNGVATGDFDGDGRMDIVAANWGLNSFYQACSQKPLQLAYGDFDPDGFLDLLETEYAGNRIVRAGTCLSWALCSLLCAIIPDSPRLR